MAFMLILGHSPRSSISIPTTAQRWHALQEISISIHCIFGFATAPVIGREYFLRFWQAARALVQDCPFLEFSLLIQVMLQMS